MIDETPNDVRAQRAPSSSTVSVFNCNDLQQFSTLQTQASAAEMSATIEQQKATIEEWEARAAQWAEKEALWADEEGALRGGDRAPQQSKRSQPRARVAVEGEKNVRAPFRRQNRKRSVRGLNNISRRIFIVS